MKKQGPIAARLILIILLSGCVHQPVATPLAAQLPSATEAPPNPQPLILDATHSPVEPVDLNVFAAASLTAAFEEIGQKFEADHRGVTVVFNFASSQQLARQIKEGAPADVYASANHAQMMALIDAGVIDADTQQTFVNNRLVVIYPEDNPGHLKKLTDLTRPDLKLVLAAKEVPVGQYSLDFLEKAAADPGFGADYNEEVLKNVVSYEENVKVVLTKVVLGEADAGIVYRSDVTGDNADKVSQIEIPDPLNVIANYPIAPVRGSRQPELAQAFIELVLSPGGQTILAKYGFLPAVTSEVGGVSGPFTITDRLDQGENFKQQLQRIVWIGTALIISADRCPGIGCGWARRA